MNIPVDFCTKLEPATVKELREAAERIRVRLRRSAEDIIAIGRDLLGVKELLGHGEFLAWLNTEFEMSERTARNFMQVAERFGKTAKIADMPISVLYELAAPSTPDTVVEEITARVAQGEKPTVAEVREAKRVAQPEQVDLEEAIASVDPIAAKRERREKRERELAARIVAMPTKRYGVAYVDPPWRFEPWSRETGMDRAADNHYPTMALDDIKALEIPAADDSICFMWATRPMLPQALALMSAWKFAYKTCFVWHKPKSGTGYWARDNAEVLLVGTRGEIPAPAPGDQFDALFEAATGAHSEKPERAYEIIESYFPSLPKLELFARKARPGWDAWGNEIEAAEFCAA